GAHALSGCIGAGCLLRRRVEGIARVLQCPLWASCKVRVEVRGDINSTLLQKPMDVSQFWRRYCHRVRINASINSLVIDRASSISLWEAGRRREACSPRCLLCSTGSLLARVPKRLHFVSEILRCFFAFGSPPKCFLRASRISK